MCIPKYHTHMRFFPKLLPHSWKKHKKTVYNVLYALELQFTFHWN